MVRTNVNNFLLVMSAMVGWRNEKRSAASVGLSSPCWQLTAFSVCKYANKKASRCIFSHEPRCYISVQMYAAPRSLDTLRRALSVDIVVVSFPTCMQSFCGMYELDIWHLQMMIILSRLKHSRLIPNALCFVYFRWIPLELTIQHEFDGIFMDSNNFFIWVFYKQWHAGDGLVLMANVKVTVGI